MWRPETPTPPGDANSPRPRRPDDDEHPQFNPRAAPATRATIGTGFQESLELVSPPRARLRLGLELRVRYPALATV